LFAPLNLNQVYGFNKTLSKTFFLRSLIFRRDFNGAKWWKEQEMGQIENMV